MLGQACGLAGSVLLCVRSMCKHQFRDRQAHHSHSGINKLAVCRSQLNQGTQELTYGHLALGFSTNCNRGEGFTRSKKPCLIDRWQRGMLTGNLRWMGKKTS